MAPASPSSPAAILVIKHGALGDVVLATAAMRAIREGFPTAHITCLTTRAYAGLFASSPYCDTVEIDIKPKPWQVGRMLALLRCLNRHPWCWVFDLQTSTRSTFYARWLVRRAGAVSGIHPGFSHAYTNPARHGIHAFETLREQLAIAGLSMSDLPDINWLEGKPAAAFGLHTPYALLVPGGAAHRPQKRWPAGQYAALAQWLVDEKGLIPVLIGTQAEAQTLAEIQAQTPACVSLLGQTTFGDIATLARGAVVAVGNDTGPMHLIAGAGAPCLTLFGADSRPELSAPLGIHANYLRHLPLSDLSQHTVRNLLETLTSAVQTPSSPA